VSAIITLGSASCIQGLGLLLGGELLMGTPYRRKIMPQPLRGSISISIITVAASTYQLPTYTYSPSSKLHLL